MPSWQSRLKIWVLRVRALLSATLPLSVVSWPQHQLVALYRGHTAFTPVWSQCVLQNTASSVRYNLHRRDDALSKPDLPLGRACLRNAKSIYDPHWGHQKTVLGVQVGCKSRKMAAAPKSMLYTRGGDSGTSSLFNNARCAKDSVVFQALGNLDELNCVLGLCRQHALRGLGPVLYELQCTLFEIGSHVATPRDSTTSEELRAMTAFADGAARVSGLEALIDELDARVPALKAFILPAGGAGTTALHLARATCRRTERSLVPLLQEGACEEQVYRFINRLSDLLFAMARFHAYRWVLFAGMPHRLEFCNTIPSSLVWWLCLHSSGESETCYSSQRTPRPLVTLADWQPQPRSAARFQISLGGLYCFGASVLIIALLAARS